jgi:GxxExxY protein
LGVRKIKIKRKIMNTKIKSLNTITKSIIGSATEVHKNLGPGLLEQVYERALCHELKLNSLQYKKQIEVPVYYKGINLGDYCLGLLVENEVIVEIKAVDGDDSLSEARMKTFLKVTGKTLGLLINFNVPVLGKGIRKIIL